MKESRPVSPETQARIDAGIERVLQMFHTEDFPERVAETFLHRQAGGERPCSGWSLVNILLMLAQGSVDARTMKEWNRVGRRVRAGSKAIYIRRPTRKIAVKMTDEDGNEQVVPLPVDYGWTPRYRYEDTEGDPLAIPDYRPIQLPPLYDVAEKLGLRVDYGPCEGKFAGYYAHRAKRIHLCTHDVNTFFHELAHAAHATFHRLTGGQEAVQEIVAEMTACVLAILYGYEGFVWNGHKYIAHYAQGKSPAEAVLQCLVDVQRTLGVIMSTHMDDPVERPDVLVAA